MRVMHVITRMIVGGAQENTLWTCIDLAQEFGDQVILVTGPTAGPEGRLLEQGRGAEIEITQITELTRPIRLWNDFRAYKKLRHLIREWKPDVVHTHSAKGGFLGRLAAWAEKVPVVVHTVHGAPFHPYQSAIARTLFQFCERYAAKRCHGLISVADAMTDLMVSAHIAPRNRFKTIYSGIETEPYLEAFKSREAARLEFGFNGDDLVIGKVARLFRLKGHDDLISAAQRLVARNPRLKFLLVGDGDLRPQLETKIRLSGLGDHVVFTGLVPPERVPYCMSAMDLLVHTSLREGLARTLPQALLCGIPIVSYDIDGAREVCINGVTGYLVPPQNIDGLVSSIEKLCADSELRNRLAHEGQELCRHRFPHQSMTAQIRELYVRLTPTSFDRTQDRMAVDKRLD